MFAVPFLRRLPASNVRYLRTVKNSEQAASMAKAEIVPDTEAEEYVQTQDFFRKVNQDIEQKRQHGRLFAICHLYGQQHMFTEGDLIMVNKHFPADIGSRIKLEKCMFVGGENVSLVGRPVLDRDLVHIEATVIEKTMSHTVSNIVVIPRTSGKRRFYFQRMPLTTLRINEIEICHKLNESQDEVH